MSNNYSIDKFVAYELVINNYNEAGPIETAFNSILIMNTGTVTAYLNNIPIQPGGYIEPPAGNLGEVCNTAFYLTFQTTGLPADPVQSVFVMRKIYNTKSWAGEVT